MTEAGAGTLYVDLDGTLTRSDVLVESVFALLRSSPLAVLLLPGWLLKGRAHFKREIAKRVDIDPAGLPWNEEFLRYLRDSRAAGRSVVLITASDQKYADAVAGHLGIFDDAIGSDGETNLSGRRKLERMLADAGGGGFDYAGNSAKDLEIWPQSDGAIVVNAPPWVLEKARARANVVRVVDPLTGLAGKALRAARVHQWAKNLLLFVPLVLSHRFADVALLSQAVAGFLAFGLCASAVYLLNDLLDLQDDRRHPTKRHRMLSAGEVPLELAAALIPLLFAGAVLISLALPGEFLAFLLIYAVTTSAYSLRLKQIAVLDVLLLSGLYTLRLLAGGAATGVAVSFWLLLFSLFLFLSLALLKRYTEVRALNAAAPGRGYEPGDDALLRQFGTSSGYIAVLVLAFYINSEQVRIQYSWPEAIWLLCPLMLYWVTRVWLLAHRGKMHEDPVMFAIRDPVSLWLIPMALLILWVAA